VVLLAGVNYVFARLLIDESVESQLEAVRDTRIQALEIGFDRLETRVATLAANPSVGAALADLSSGFEAINEDITPAQVAQLTDLYETEALPPFVDAGVDIPPDELVPAAAAGRYVQHHYIAENPDGFDERDGLDDAGDGSVYSAAHAVHHPLLRALMENAGMDDLLLLDAETANVVYSTKKRIDLGTNGVSGPYANDGLGEVLGDLTSVAVGDAVVSDTFFYVPTSGAPVFFIAAAVRSGPEVVGAVVAEVPVEALNAVMTADQDWQLLGLGDTGESYVVGVDGTLRSESRAWIEDPDDYLRRHADRYDDQDATDLIATVGSPVLLQPVDNAAVTTAADDGKQFLGTVTNYLGVETLAASAPVDVSGLDWVVVVERNTSETDKALSSFLRTVLIELAILLPIIALVGFFLARTLTRPAHSLVDAADRIAGGDLDTEVQDLGKNELGDLGRQLEGVARELESRDQAIVGEEQNIKDMLSAVLPARLVDRFRSGEQAIEDIFDTATIISVTVEGIPEAVGVDQDVVLEIADRLNEETDALMEQHGIERIMRSQGSQLFAAGLGEDDAQVTEAARFVASIAVLVPELGSESGHELTVRVGLSAGEVATGVLGGTQMSFSVWGDAPNTAVTLGAIAEPGQMLADQPVSEALGVDWDIGPAEDLPGLADDVEAHVVRPRS
jgi:class 3 adenylate cyclase